MPFRHQAALRSAILLLPLVAACARPAPPVAPTPAVLPFTRMADSLLASPPLHRAHIGIVVYDPEADRVLYAHNAQRHFVPASNQKYWPTATALQVLGPDFRYSTPVWAVGLDPAEGTVGTLVVEGRGDPTWSRRFHDDDLAVPGFLADSIVAAGVRRVTGDLVVDASRFDESLIPGTWTFGNLNGTSAPSTGALAVAEGIVEVEVVPGPGVGDPAIVVARAPEGIVPVRSDVRTGEPEVEGRLSVRRGPWDDTLRISGQVEPGAEPRTLRVPMTDPVRFAAAAFADALRERGVEIEGAVRVVRDSTEAGRLRGGGGPTGPAAATVGSAAPAGAPATGGAMTGVTVIATWTSPPLSDIVTAVLQPSQNWIAEQLVRTLGAEVGEGGGWRQGIEVAEAFLHGTLGIDPDALRMQDGSGMSHQNLVTPWAVVQLLDHARTAPWGPVFRDALTGPGRPGTLSRRLQGLEGRVTGKTGTLSNVNALSGYVTTRDGRELIFSILSNASGLGSGPVVSAIDRMVQALAEGEMPR